MSLADDARRGPNARIGVSERAAAGSWLLSDAPGTPQPPPDLGGSWLLEGEDAPTPLVEVADNEVRPVPDTEVRSSATSDTELTASLDSTAVVDHDRRTRAVDVYCNELCPADAASAAATENLDSFPGGDDSDLLRHIRVTAANHATVKPARRGWRQTFAAERDSECAATPVVLAERDNGALDPARAAELEKHLSSCATCQAAELRARRAERAFAAVIGGAAAAEIASKAQARPASAPVQTASGETAAPSPVLDPPTPQPAEAQTAWLAAPELTPEAVAATAAAAPTAVAPSVHRGGRRTWIAVLAGVAGVAIVAAVLALALSSSGSKTLQPRTPKPRPL